MPELTDAEMITLGAVLLLFITDDANYVSVDGGEVTLDGHTPLPHHPQVVELIEKIRSNQ